MCNTCNCGENCSCEPKTELKELLIGGDIYSLSQDQINAVNKLRDECLEKFSKNLENVIRDTIPEESNIRAKFLFTVNKTDDAWNEIRNNLDNINFADVTSYEYFVMDRMAQDVYKYMHDNGIIDDTNYAYFQVLGGELSDLDFWKSYLEGKTTREKLDTINQCYLGINPFQVGLVAVDDESSEFLLENLEDGELLDEYIIGDKPAVFFPIFTLMGFIRNHNISDENWYKLIDIIVQVTIQTIDNEQNPDQGDVHDVLNSLWEFVATTANVIEENKNVPGITGLTFDTIPKLKSFIESRAFSDIMYKEYSNLGVNTIYEIITNSVIFMNYPYLVRHILNSIGFDIDGLDIASYIHDENLPYALSYRLLNFVNTDNIIIKYPFPAVFNCIYNKLTNKVFINGMVKQYDRDDIHEFDFVDEYIETEMISDSELFDKCSSVQEFEEIVYAVKQFKDNVDKVILNN